jgi:hypothetical protein
MGGERGALGVLSPHRSLVTDKREPRWRVFQKPPGKRYAHCCGTNTLTVRFPDDESAEFFGGGSMKEGNLREKFPRIQNRRPNDFSLRSERQGGHFQSVTLEAHLEEPALSP